jgi:hypothetical protein
MRSPMGAFLTALIALVGCESCVRSDQSPVSITEAREAWNALYGADCYAPRDLGSSVYPTDQIDRDCFRTVIEKVEQVDDQEFCLTSLTQATWKFSDTAGFGIGSITRSRACYFFQRDESGTARLAMSRNYSDLGEVPTWPEN